MIQLHLSDQQFYCLLRCGLYYRFDDSVWKQIKGQSKLCVRRLLTTYNWHDQIKSLMNLIQKKSVDQTGKFSCLLFHPTVTKFCHTGGTSPPHHPNVHICRWKIPDKVILSWSSIHGSSWSGLDLVKAEREESNISLKAISKYLVDIVNKMKRSQSSGPKLKIIKL